MAAYLMVVAAGISWILLFEPRWITNHWAHWLLPDWLVWWK